jgi:ribosomal protein S18 acetylase RimI-like enzyme
MGTPGNLRGQDNRSPARPAARHTQAVLTIKVLTTDDWPLWREARLAALAEAPYAFGSRLADWQGDGDREERWRQRLSLVGAYNLIAMLDGVPAGMAAGMPGDEPAEAKLISMWMAPKARGRRVGDTLINEVESWARAAGYAWLLLLVKADNRAAIQLYERNCFAFVPGVRVDEDGEHAMAKELSAS